MTSPNGQWYGGAAKAVQRYPVEQCHGSAQLRRDGIQARGQLSLNPSSEDPGDQHGSAYCFCAIEIVTRVSVYMPWGMVFEVGANGVRGAGSEESEGEL